MRNNSKVHYKMYKAGKRWLFAAIATTMITTGGFALNEVHADTVNTSNDATIVKAQTETESKADNETQTQDSTVTTTDAKTNTTDATSQPETTVAPVEEQKDVTTNTQNNNEEPKAESSQATTDETPVDTTSETKASEPTSSTDDVTADKTVTATNNQNMQLNTATVNLAVDQPAPASDVSVDVAAQVPSSATDPYNPDNNVAYDIKFTNNSDDSSVIPTGTSVKFAIGTPTNNDMSKFLKASTPNFEAGLFNVVDNGDGTFTINVNEDLAKGVYTVTLNFIAQDPGYGWDGTGNNTDPNVVTANVSATYDYEGSTSNAPIADGQTIYVKPRPYSIPGAPGIPGFDTMDLTGSGYPTDPAYPQAYKGYLGSTQDNTNLYNPTVLSADGSSYVAGMVNGNPWAIGGTQINTITAQINANSGNFDLNHVHLLYHKQDGTNTVIDISNDSRVKWTKTGTKIVADVSGIDASTAFGQGDFDIVFYIPAKSTDVIQVQGYLNWQNEVKNPDGTYAWNNGNPIDSQMANMISVFQPTGVNATTPWFVGGDQTVYQNKQGDVTYAPMTGISAYDGTTGNLTDKVTVTDLGGYPADGVNPATGEYTIAYSVTNDENVTSTFSRVITVKASEASVNGNDVIIYAGDAMPAASAFGASATADDGSAIPADQISIDTSQVNPNVSGDYPVTISADNGEVTKEVNVHVLANQAKVTAHDVTIYTGENVPTDAIAYDATAVGKDGQTSVGIKSVDTSQVNNQVAGTYPVIITDDDGVSTQVNVIVLADQAKVTAHNVTIHTGNAVPTDPSAYGASAVGKDGTTPVAIASVDTSKVDNQTVGTYPVVITDADGVSTTVNVEVVANQASISGQDVTIYAGEAVPAASAFEASATDEDGKAIAVTVDTSKVNNQVAGTYPVTITAADGQTKEVSVIVLADQAKVTAHDVTIHTGDVVPTDPSAYGASAVGKDGTTPVAIASVDTSKVDNQTVGNYPVVITDADGVSTTVNVEVVANQASISGQDVTIYAGDPMPADSAFKASATDEDGKEIAVTIDTSKVKPDIVGTYPVTITAADGQTKEVSVIVLADQAKVTAHDVTIYTGDVVPTDPSAYGASAVGKDGKTLVAIASVDTSKVDNQTVGTYPVVITDADGVSTTVNVEVVANQASISGQDVTIYAGEAVPAASAFEASATDEDGKAIAVTVDTSKVDNQVAGTYPVTITAADGQTKEVSVIVLADQAKVTAHDVTIHTGDAVPTDPSAYGASAVGKDGKTSVAIASVDTSKVDNQTVGTYPVVITDADGVSTTVNVEVVANQASISGQDVTIYAGEAVPAASAFEASATDEDGKAIAVTVDTSKVDNQVAGTYPVTITAADGQTKEVSVIVLADQAKVTAHDVTIHTGDVVPTDPSAYGASAVGKDGTTPVAIASVDTSKVDNQTVGTYPVVITDADGVSTTVNVEVKASAVTPSTTTTTTTTTTTPAQPSSPVESVASVPVKQTDSTTTDHLESNVSTVNPVAKETQTVSASETPAETKTTKQTGLPKTGQDATASLMSIIGVILLSILGFFGLDGFRKKKENK